MFHLKKSLISSRRKPPEVDRYEKGTSRFKYSPLPRGGWIRLLTLRAGRPDQTLECQLSPVKIDEATDYEAVSYVWGDADQTRDVLCNGLPLAVTVSLHDALVRVRDRVKDLRLWADAICINQSDIRERGEQVGRMSTIFRRALNVLIWLGPDTHGDAGEAVRLIHDINRFVRESGIVFTHSKGPEIPDPQSPLLDPRRVGAVVRMCKRPWFSRVWVLQEIGLAMTATVLYGSASVSWIDFMAYAAFSELSESYRIFWTPRPYPFAFVESYAAIWQAYETSGSWHWHAPALRGWGLPGKRNLDWQLAMYVKSGCFNATDPRDHIYAFTGHPWSLDVPANYTIPAERLFRQVAEHFLHNMKSLKLLAFAGVFERPEGSSLPSWVPWWAPPKTKRGTEYLTTSFPRLESSPFFDADLHKQTGKYFRLKTQKKGPRLTVCGFVFDTIDKISEPMNDTDFLRVTDNSGAQERTTVNPIDSIWTDLLGRRQLGPQDLDKLGMTLACGKDGQLERLAVDDLRPNFKTYVRRHCGDELLASLGWTSLRRGGGDEKKKSTGDNDDDDDNDAPSIAVNPFHIAADYYVHGCRFFVTGGSERFGLGPYNLREGDVCAVLLGSRLPLVLRPTGKHAQYTLVGECYVDGVMDGEVVKGQYRGAVLDTETISIV